MYLLRTEERMSLQTLVYSALFLSLARFPAFVDACGGTLTEMSGEISTPNYPQSYPTNITCTWRIMGGNSHVNMTFLDFQLEASPNCKNFDYLEVGYDAKRRIICNFPRPWFWVLPVEGNEIELKFKSDVSVTHRGFKLTYDKYDIDGCLTENGGCAHECSFRGGKVKCHCRQGYVPHRLSWERKDSCYDIDECNSRRQHDCDKSQMCINTPGSFNCVCKYGYNKRTHRCDDACGGTLTEMSGEISTPNYPHRYPNNMMCTWRIKGGNSQVNITFLDFELESCTYDYLKVVYRNTTLQFCGTRQPRVDHISVKDTADIVLTFKSDASVTYRGFKLSYNKYDIDGCLTENGGCAHECSFRGGKVKCHCRQGYRLSLNGKDCDVS